MCTKAGAETGGGRVGGRGGGGGVGRVVPVRPLNGSDTGVRGGRPRGLPRPRPLPRPRGVTAS